MNGAPGTRPAEILLIEDNPADIRLTQEVFQEGKVAHRLHVVSDGERAMEFLRGEARYVGAPRPDLVLLDLNLPGKDGREVLSEIKQDPALRRIPVVVMTGSAAEADVYQAYDLSCNCYLAKPLDLAEFVKVVRSIEEFWLTIVTLPPRESRQ